MSPGEPSLLFQDWREALRSAALGGPVLDVACGRGRHALPAARLGARVIALDRDAAALTELAVSARAEALALQPLRADLERGYPPPLAPASCAAVLVFRYLHRPAAAGLAELLQPGGLLLYETFTQAQRDLPQGPKNPDFLLGPGELPRLFPGLLPEHSWEGLTPGPQPQALARLVARRPG